VYAFDYIVHKHHNWKVHQRKEESAHIIGNVSGCKSDRHKIVRKRLRQVVWGCLEEKSKNGIRWYDSKSSNRHELREESACVLWENDVEKWQ